MTHRRSPWPPPPGPREPRRIPDPGSSHPTHSHQLPRAALWCAIGLAVVQVLIITGLALLAVYVWQDHEYVQGRGQYRDQEQARLEEDIRQATCDLLDKLPAGPLLDSVRQQYRCGPGIPVDQLPPEIQAEIGARRLTPPQVVPGPDRAAPPPVSVTP